MLHEALRLDKSEKVERFQKILSHKSSLQDWLRELGTKGEEWISKEDLVDKLVQSGVPQESALLFFSHLDDYRSSRLHVPRIMDELENETIRKDIPSSVTRLSACVMLPSILDVFLQGESLLDSQREQARMLNTYVKNCSAPSQEFTNKDLNFFFSLSQSRQQLLRSHFEKFGKSSFEADTSDDSVSGFEAYQKVHKPFSSVVVSSNASKADQLFDGNNTTYWQSSGTQGGHYIRLFILPQVFIEQLSITVSSSDNSYMPRVVDVMGGPTESSLHRLVHRSIFKRSSRCQTEVLMNSTSNYYKVIQVTTNQMSALVMCLCTVNPAYPVLSGKHLGYFSTRKAAKLCLFANSLVYRLILKNARRTGATRRCAASAYRDTDPTRCIPSQNRRPPTPGCCAFSLQQQPFPWRRILALGTF